MRGKIPEMLKLEVKLKFEKSGDTADISMYTEFESRESLNAYQEHPAHMPAKKNHSACSQRAPCCRL